MGSQSFDVLNINRSTCIMTIVRVDLFDQGVCTTDLNNTLLDNALVSYRAGTQNITLFYSCQSAFLVEVNDDEKFSCGTYNGISSNGSWSKIIWLRASQECQKNITISIMGENLEEFELGTLPLPDLIRKGFQVAYKLQTIDMCNNCEDSGGVCGSNITTNQFTCLCKDGPHTESCPISGASIMKKKFAIILIGVCLVIGSLILIIGVWCFHKVVMKEISKRRKEKCFKPNGGLLLHQGLLAGDNNSKKIKVFKSNELEKATNNYNVEQVLGQGGQGTVYKGILSDGKLVAVKKSKIVDTKNIGQFLNEVAILSQINHRNIVRLLGYCLESEVPILVYEFISNGTLHQQLHNPTKKFMLNWEMRLRIATEIASTLSYLHNAAPVPIYHRDIKSTNILLDDKFNAKVADFGISRLVEIDVSHLTTLVRGTFGYVDPEYYQSSRFTEKSDVYSFGVVLVELLTGQKPIFSDKCGELKGLAPYFMELMEDKQFLKILDSQLSNEDNTEEIVEVAHIAKACLDPIGKRRPTMKEIVVKLEGIKILQEKCTCQERSEIDVGEACDDSSTGAEAWGGSTTTSSRMVEISSLPKNK